MKPKLQNYLLVLTGLMTGVLVSIGHGVFAERENTRATLPVEELRTFRQFDHAITAPLHGFSGVDDYYERSSCKQFLQHIAIPTLMLQARDDPFLPEAALPDEADLGSTVTLEISRRGGHVGYISGWNPLQPIYWLEQRILQHLATFR